MALDYANGPLTVAVVGAGAMGRGIAQVSATGGMRVLLYDAAEGAAAAGRDYIAGMLQRSVERGRMAADDAAAALANVVVAARLEEIAPADVVIEAIVERLDVKRELFRRIEGIVRGDAIVATNTSSLRVAAIAADCTGHARIAGLHFFNPVPLMKLVEVVRAPATADAVVEALVAVGRRMGRVPVVVKDGPGFLVNLGGRAFTTEGLRLVHEGVARPEQVDAVMRDACGFRMGPFELMDLTGIDVNFPASIAIYEGYFHDRRIATYPMHETLHAAGRFGRKTRQGHYAYDENGTMLAPGADHLTDAAPAPRVCLVDEDDELAALLHAAGARVLAEDDGESPLLAAPIGEDATSVAIRAGCDPARLVCVDLTGDVGRRVTIMTPPGGDPAVRDAVAARLAAGGARVTAIHDSPGFIAQRMLAMIANLGCEIAQIGVATPADIDTAMTLGLNYPRGPLGWADHLGPARVLAILDAAQATTGEERYRPSLWLRRRALLNLPIDTPN